MNITKRELEICKLLVLGKSNIEIGEILNISHYTVKWYIPKLLKKFNADNRTHLAYILGRKNVV